MRISFFLLSFFFLCLESSLALETKGRGGPEFRICTQNLYRYGEITKKRSKAWRAKQESYLVQRFLTAKCDCIALQEVFGQSMDEARANLENLTAALAKSGGGQFLILLGETRDEHIRNGFLIREGLGEVLSTVSHSSSPVPRLTALGPLRYFSRGPFTVFLSVEKRGGERKKFAITNIHFKSRSNSWKDPSRTEFEAPRMEMAEAVIQIAESHLQKSGAIPIVIGDRNSEPESASAEILLGRRRLIDFITPGGCELSRQLKAACRHILPHRPILTALFSHAREKHGREVSRGSYRYRGKLLQIDDILVPKDELRMFSRSSGLPAIGDVGRFRKGSDHKLLWADVDW